MTDQQTLLSVVIVTYNEAEKIADCIESVRSACRPVGEFEVIVVDGNSTDDTVSIASSYPVTVLRTDEDVISTPSSGRHVGTEFANGRYTLFIDGDTELADGWIEPAIDRIEDDPDVAGVTGYFNEVDDDETVREVDSIGRTFLYETRALREVGGFDPYLNSLEDVDVSFRLRQAGYTLYKLPEVVGYHPDQNGINERFRRWNQGFYYGNGEVVRKYLDRPSLLEEWLTRLRLWFGTLGWLGLGAVAATRGNRARQGWLLGSALMLGSALVQRDSTWVKRKLLSNLLLIPVGFTRGFLRYPSSPPEYPLETVEIVHEPRDLQAAA